MSERRSVAVLGCTGSVGTQALEVIAAHPDRFRVVALAAHRSADRLAHLAAEHGVPPERARLVAEDPGVLAELAALDDVDVVLNAVVGFAGLPATIAALEHHKRLALANKESLIAAGPVVAEVRARSRGEIVPVDSEHSAIWQALRAGRPSEVARITLTASGGPFRGRRAAELAEVTVAEALAHPTWRMGPKITVDSSTLMNKGLEVIEAHELFGIDYDRIDVVVHPQSVVHGMVTFADGSTIAQLSRPDMRLPIGLALGAPERLDTAFGALDWTSPLDLSFEAPDRATFRGLDLAYRAGRAGGNAPATLSAANEVAVEAFLAGRIGWADITAVVEEVLDAGTGAGWPRGPDDIVDADARARARAEVAVRRRSRP